MAWMRENDRESASAYDRPDISKTWRRKDGSLLRPPEPETYKISLTRDQSQALKALAKAEGVLGRAELPGRP